MLEDDLVVGDDDAFDDEPEHPLACRKRGICQQRRDALAERSDRRSPVHGLLGLRHLSCYQLLPLLDLLPRVAQALTPLLPFVYLDGPDLIGINEALFLPRERQPLPLQALELPCGIRAVRTLSLLLLPQVL